MEVVDFLRKVYYTYPVLQRALYQKTEPAILKTRNFQVSWLYNSTKCVAAIDPPRTACYLLATFHFLNSLESSLQKSELSLRIFRVTFQKRYSKV
jgi:hypothetical protein